MSETKEAFKRSLKGAFTHAKRILKTNNTLKQGLAGAGVGAVAGGAPTYAATKAIQNSESFKKRPEKEKKKFIKRHRRLTLGSAVTGAAYGGVTGAADGYLKDWSRGVTKGRRKRRSSNREAPPPRRPLNTPTPGWLKNVKTKAEAKKLYREKANTHHPDKGGNTKDMQDLNSAWDAFKKSPDFDKLGMRLPSFFQELRSIKY